MQLCKFGSFAYVMMKRERFTLESRPVMVSPSTFARRSAAAGAVVWVLLLLVGSADSSQTELIHKVALFGIFVIVPLGVAVAGDQFGSPSLYKLVVLVQPFAALMAAASLFVAMGVRSALLASAWLILTGLVALFGLTRLIARGLYPLPELSIDAGLMYLPVAAGWLVIYRLGVQPFGYGETIILLTVVHFHFAGFAAPIIAGANGRVLATRNYPEKMFTVSIVAIVTAMPLVAAGITFTPVLGLIGALLLSLGLVLLAVLTLGWVVPVVAPAGKRLLLVIAALSSCAAMVLACLYAYSLVAKILILNIPTMAMSHGLLNAFGFATCSLVAWSRANLK